MQSAYSSLVAKELSRGNAISIINLFDSLLLEGRMRRASDIHIDPNAKAVNIRLRIDGVLQHVHELPKSVHHEIISRIKVLSGLRTDEHQAGQDGRFRALLDGDEPLDVRVSITPTYYGENAVLRLLSNQSHELTLEALGFSVANRQKILGAIAKPFGMILATGPTGSGKTTTLYTLIKILNTDDVSIITIEDPVEYAIADVTQIQINTAAGLTFSNGLRSILRQDPNIIMVGEIRDSATASLSVNTALTGHLLLSTLHTNDAATTLPRLLDMGIDPYLVASTANIAIGQRLVRKICEDCRHETHLAPSEAESISKSLAQQIRDKKHWYRGLGCESCRGTGYFGRISINEVLVVDDRIREAILQKAPASSIREIAMQNGMTTILQDGYHKASEGQTTIAEVLRIIHD